jgi:alpha-1,6-mannosyltransferase
MSTIRRPLLSVWVWIALSLLLHGLLAVRFSLLPNYDVAPPVDVRSFTPSLRGGLGYALVVASLYLFYLLACRAARSRTLSLAQILGVTLLLALPLLFVYPINANDLFRYFIRARITTLYGENPLAVAPDAFPGDPYLPLAGEWADESSPYGPVWELAAAGITLLSGQNLLVALLLFKGLALAAHLGCAAVVWRQTSVDQRVSRTALWAWNPALLLIFVVDAHNDGLMLLWLLWGAHLVRTRPVAGLLVALLGPLTKLIGLLALPFLFLETWRRQADSAARRRLLAGTVAGGLLLATLSFLPFGSPLPLVTRLLREASEAPGFSPLTVIWLVAERNELALDIELLGLIGIGLFVALYAWLLRVTWQGRPAVSAIAGAFGGYLLTALAFRIWYTAWVFPWLLLEQRPGRRLAGGLALLLAAQLSVVVYGHVRVFLLDYEQAEAHVIGVLLVFGLPLLVAAAQPVPRSDRRQK